MDFDINKIEDIFTKMNDRLMNLVQSLAEKPDENSDKLEVMKNDIETYDDEIKQFLQFFDLMSKEDQQDNNGDIEVKVKDVKKRFETVQDDLATKILLNAKKHLSQSCDHIEKRIFDIEREIENGYEKPKMREDLQNIGAKFSEQLSVLKTLDKDSQDLRGNLTSDSNQLFNLFEKIKQSQNILSDLSQQYGNIMRSSIDITSQSEQNSSTQNPRLRSIYLFLTTLCIVCILQTAISAGYMSSQLTTLERRFSLDSYMLGLIQSFFDVGFILSVIFVGYFGGRGRIPLWIGIGMLIMSTGAFSFSLPQFITKYNFVPHVGVQDSEMCLASNSTSVSTSCNSGNKATWLVKLFFILGQLLIGCGSSPILSLGPTYIDDHVTETLAPPLIALLYASSGLGPVVGFGLGAVMLQHPADGVSSKGSKPGDHDWIGAWWGGYVCLGALAASTAIFLVLFPRRVRKIKDRKKSKDAVELGDGVATTTDPLMENKLQMSNGKKTSKNNHGFDKSESSIQTATEKEVNDYGKSIKDMPKAILSLITNKVFVVVSLAICCEMFLVNGFAAFLPKYIENEYKVSNITASLIAGGLIVPAGALGIIVGGLIMHRYQLSRRKAVLFSILGVLLVLVCMVLFFLFGCNNPSFAGITTPFNYNDSNIFNISNQCNRDTCMNTCDPNQFSPVCDVKAGVTFFSPCYAGCSNFTMDSNKTSMRPKYFYNCSCTTLHENITASTVLKVGECKLKCNSLITFVLFLTLALFLTGITQNPLLMVTMRSVAKHERSFALGFQFVILRILAYIPSPIVYGTVIDAACVHWKWICGDRGDCLVTDLKQLNYNLIGLSFAVKCGAAFFYILLFFIIPKLDSDGNSSNCDKVVVVTLNNGDISKTTTITNDIGPSLS